MAADPQPPSTKPYFADTFGGIEDGLDPHEASGWLIDRLASAVKLSPDWFVDDDVPVPFRLILVAHQPDVRLSVEIAGGGILAHVIFSKDASGYVLVVGEHEGREVFRGYMDVPYEEADIWPAGAAFPDLRPDDAPGRLGKRLSWAVLNTRTWPGLAPLANEAGYVQARAEE